VDKRSLETTVFITSCSWISVPEIWHSTSEATGVYRKHCSWFNKVFRIGWTVCSDYLSLTACTVSIIQGLPIPGDSLQVQIFLIPNQSCSSLLQAQSSTFLQLPFATSQPIRKSCYYYVCWCARSTMISEVNIYKYFGEYMVLYLITVTKKWIQNFGQETIKAQIWR